MKNKLWIYAVLISLILSFGSVVIAITDRITNTMEYLSKHDIKIEKMSQNELTLTKAIKTIIEYLETEKINRNLELDLISKNLNLIADSIPKVADNRIKLDKIEKRILEEKLRYVNVFIENKDNGIGSGVSLKYKNEFYILSAAHMVENEKEDTIYLKENDQVISELEVLGIDKEADLVLFRPKTKGLVPRFYVELAETTPYEADEVMIVGNPCGFEDIVNEGRVMFYRKGAMDEGNREVEFMYYFDHTYFGNSGGGVYDLQGNLVGIVSHLIPIRPDKTVDFYTINGAVSLQEINIFLGKIVG